MLGPAKGLLQEAHTTEVELEDGENSPGCRAGPKPAAAGTGAGAVSGMGTGAPAGEIMKLAEERRRRRRGGGEGEGGLRRWKNCKPGGARMLVRSVLIDESVEAVAIVAEAIVRGL